MSSLVTLFRILVDVYRLIVALYNACAVFVHVLQSLMREAKQDAAEVMALLDDGAPITDVMMMSASSSLLRDADAANPWQMLIVARASSFVLLLRLSTDRVLHLEVDERFVASKLQVIQTELTLNAEHIPRLLQTPIGMYDTRLVRYTPMKLPYLWKEEETVSQGGGGEVVERSATPAVHASSVGEGAEERSHRKKYVQLLAESAVRRLSHMDRLKRDALSEVGPKRGMGVAKNQGENVVKRKALANATNARITDADALSEEMRGLEKETRGGTADTPKQVRMERHIHAALCENLSLPNMEQAVLPRKAAESAQQPPRRMGYQSLRRKRGQFDLYAQGVPSEFTLVPKTDRGRD